MPLGKAKQCMQVAQRCKCCVRINLLGGREFKGLPDVLTDGSGEQPGRQVVLLACQKGGHKLVKVRGSACCASCYQSLEQWLLVEYPGTAKMATLSLAMAMDFDVRSNVVRCFIGDIG